VATFSDNAVGGGGVVDGKVEEDEVEEDEVEEETTQEIPSDEEIEVEEFIFENKTYYTDDAQNGHLFECLEDGEIGDIVGNLENGSVFFS
jgi:hypothetical protein